MIPNMGNQFLIKQGITFVLIGACLTLSLPIFADTVPYTPLIQNEPAGVNSTLSAMDMLTNFATNIPNLMRLITAIAYVMGMVFIIKGIMQLKHFGEMRTMMSQEHGLMAPFILLGVGTLLLYLPTSVQVGMSTFWTSPCPYCYPINQSPWTQFLSICYAVIQLFGVIAFIRGLIVLTHLGGRSGHSPDTFSKGLTYIIGGVFCINIYGAVQIILFTFGFQLGQS
jgi:intracellular multiplication protein IcmC